MAKKGNPRNALIGAVLVAIVAGVVIGAVVFNDPGTAPPPPPKVEFTGEYDDSWGKEPAPVARCGVSHILVKIDANRDEAAAKKLVEQIWHKYRNEPSKENWLALQKQYNEDTADVHKVYPIPGQWMPEFIATGKSTKIGFARITKTSYGYHLIRRES